MALSFPKSARILLTSEYRRMRASGRTFGGRYMVLSLVTLRPEEEQGARFGFITSRKVGDAVTRNRVRRRLKELVRLYRPRLPEGIWLVIIARYTASTASYEELEREWRRLTRNAGLTGGARPSAPPAPASPSLSPSSE